MTVEATISDSEMSDMNPRIPPAISVRIKLNELGFKFEDDNKLSSAINDDPTPIGYFEKWYDPERCETHFKQVLEEI